MIVILLAYIIINAFNEFKWRIDLDFAFHVLNAFPIIFLIRYLRKEKKDVEQKQSIYSID